MTIREAIKILRNGQPVSAEIYDGDELINAWLVETEGELRAILDDHPHTYIDLSS